MLAGTPSAPGDELALAERCADWLAERLSRLHVELDAFAPGRANLLARTGAQRGRHLALYAHLDTSLTGEPRRDEAITARADPSTTMRVERDHLVGPGLAVAKAPAASALAALDALDRSEPDLRVTLLLAAGGTHRIVGERGPHVHFGAGVRRALAQGFRPDAVLNVKAGAPAPLHEEPGAAYLRVRIEGRWGPALFRGDDPGLMAGLGPLVSAVEGWRRVLCARPIVAGRTWGREVALGAVRAGSLDKPDLLPALLEAEVFVVLVDDDDPATLAAELRAAIAAVLSGAALDVAVHVDAFDLPASTDPGDPIVGLTVDAWSRRFGQPPAVTGWRGSTDGVVLRAAGIPTVRAGIAATRDVADPRLDRVPLGPLVEIARLYAEVAVRWHAIRPAHPG